MPAEYTERFIELLRRGRRSRHYALFLRKAYNRRASTSTLQGLITLPRRYDSTTIVGLIRE